MATLKRSSRRSARSRARPRKRAPAARRPPRRARAEPGVVVSGPADPRLIDGLALFNHRQFFACHEVLEQVWLKTHGPAKNFYKGLIQAAVACYHWSRGNLGGAMSLYRSSSRYLRTYRPAYNGVNVEEFLQRYTELFDWLRRHRTRYDPRLIPTIRWTQERRRS